jgi:hypothetical protein
MTDVWVELQAVFLDSRLAVFYVGDSDGSGACHDSHTASSRDKLRHYLVSMCLTVRDPRYGDDFPYKSAAESAKDGVSFPTVVCTATYGEALRKRSKFVAKW